jgi:hypothetical protein
MWDAVAFTQVFPSFDNEALDLLVAFPLQVALVDGPWTLALVVLLYMGLRREGAALRHEIEAEAGTGLHAIDPDEVWVLASPHQRAHQRALALARRGPRRYRWLGRLQMAQLDLATERWHRARQEIDEPLEAEAHLRDRVLALKAAQPLR